MHGWQQAVLHSRAVGNTSNQPPNQVNMGVNLFVNVTRKYFVAPWTLEHMEILVFVAFGSIT